MRRLGGIPNLKLNVPSPSNEDSLAKTQSGTFREGDLLVNKYGVRIVTDMEIDVPPPIKPSDEQLALADLDVIKVIGKGAGGVVQLVQHKWTRQFFALKVIQMNIEEKARKQIAKELKINQSLECPYIVSCYQSFYVNEAFSVILEYMDGGSLADFLGKVKSIPEPDLSAICKQVVKGLYYLHHQKHFMHRDLKPSNLLINHCGEVKITDFGVSAILTSTSGLAFTVAGTCHYMAPERFSEGANGYDYKSDIWSLGLVILECALGEYPYRNPDGEQMYSPFMVMQTIADQPPPCAPSDRFSPEFCSFISACLQKDPKNRMSTVRLLEHPFLNMYDDLEVDLAAYFTNTAPPLTTLMESNEEPEY
ncbi:hypothetical protein V2J09_000213 [Rumex salicifolius]